MKHNFILLIALFGFLSNVIGQTTYYIDSVDGSDSNNGLSEGAAWQSIGKVNQSTFLPGNRILFKSGLVLVLVLGLGLALVRVRVRVL